MWRTARRSPRVSEGSYTILNTSRIVNFNTMSDWLKNERDTFSINVEYKHRIKKNKNRRVTSETKTEDLSFCEQLASNPFQWMDTSLKHVGNLFSFCR